jgi:hypothetical protein
MEKCRKRSRQKDASQKLYIAQSISSPPKYMGFKKELWYALILINPLTQEHLSEINSHQEACCLMYM